MEKIFFNYPFNKGKLKTLLIWSILNERTINETYELEISVRHIPQHAVKQNGNKLNIEPLVTEIVPYAVWSGENVYQGKICENLTTEEAELKEMVEWAKKELSSET